MVVPRYHARALVQQNIHSNIERVCDVQMGGNSAGAQCWPLLLACLANVLWKTSSLQRGPSR